MMKYEFEQIAGYEVSYEDYNDIIEPMYIVTNLSKTEFVKTINKKRFALKPLNNIIKEMKKLAKQLEETCIHYTDYATEEKLEELVKEYINRKYFGIASYYIHTETKQTCYYPNSIEIYDTKNYKTYEIIELA